MFFKKITFAIIAIGSFFISNSLLADPVFIVTEDTTVETGGGQYIMGGDVLVEGSLSALDFLPTLTIIGVLDQGAYVQTSTGTLTIRLDSNNRNDKVLMEGGDVSLSGTLNVRAMENYFGEDGDIFYVFGTQVGTITGSFDTINKFDLPEGLFWDFSNLYVNGSITITSIPESATFAMIFGVAALGLVFSRRFSRR